jgi:hypothetical protein
LIDVTTSKLEVATTKEELGALLRSEWIRSGRPDLRGLALQVKSSKTTISEVQSGKRLVKRDLLIALLKAYQVPLKEYERWLQAWVRVASNEQANEIDTDAMSRFAEAQKRAEEAERKLVSLEGSKKLQAKVRKDLISSGEFIGRWISQNKPASEIQEIFSQLLLSEEIETRLSLLPLPEDASLLTMDDIKDGLRRGFWKGFLPLARSRLHEEGSAVPEALSEDFLSAVARMTGEDEGTLRYKAHLTPLEPWAEMTIYAPLEGHEEAFDRTVYEVLSYAASNPEDILAITYRLIPQTPNFRLLYILWHDEPIGLKHHGHCSEFDDLDNAYKNHLANEWNLDPSFNPAAADPKDLQVSMPTGGWWLRRPPH